MSREDIIRMAREAGFDEWNGSCLSGNSELDRLLAVSEYPVGEAVFKFASLVASAKQEECAKVCEARGERNRIAAGLPNGDRDEFYCADDIRRIEVRQDGEGTGNGLAARPIKARQDGKE